MNTEVQEFKKEAESAYHEIGHVFFAYYHKLFPIDEVCLLTKQEAIERGLNQDSRGATVPCTLIEPRKSWVTYVDNGSANLCIKEDGFPEFARKYYDYSIGGWYGENFYHHIVLGETGPIDKKGNHSDYHVCDYLERLLGAAPSDKYDILIEYKDAVIKLAEELKKNRTLCRENIESVMREAKLLD